MKVPVLDLRRQYAPVRGELLAQIERLFDSGQFILGPDVSAFEAEVSAYLDVNQAIGVSNGTDALAIALKAVGVGAGDWVLTTPFTFFATVSSIAAVGAVPVFADIDPVSYNLDVAHARGILADDREHRIRAIVPVHLYGQPAPMDAIESLAAEFKVPVIEDAAQAIGARWKNRPVGGYGRAGCFSFFPTKNLGGIGDSGLITTNDDALAGTLRKLRNHGAEKRYHHEMLGGNFRIDTFQALALRVFLPHLEGWIEDRRALARRYHEAFADLAPRLVAPAEIPGARHVYHQYTVRIAKAAGRYSRDTLHEFLHARDIASTVYYPIPCHRQAALSHLPTPQKMVAGLCPQAEKAAEEVLSLPIFPGMTEGEQVAVIEAVREWWKIGG